MTGLPRRIWRAAQRFENQSTAGQWAIERSRQVVDRVIRHRAVGTILDFADAVVAKQDDIAADVVVACDVTSLPAAHLVAKHRSSSVVCDVREVPDLGARSLPKSISATDLFFLNSALRQQLHDCTHLMTVGPALASLIEDQVGRTATVVPNYLTPRALQGGQLRSMAAIETFDPIIAVPNTIVGIADVLIEAVAQSDVPFHIVFVGNTKPAAYRERLEQLARALDLEHRVHWVGTVPYEQLADLLSDADLGAILLDPSIPNHHVAYPNRVFDVISGGLPLVSSPVTDITALIRRFGCGVVASENTQAAWTSALSNAWQLRQDYAAGSQRARQELTWASVVPTFRTVIPEDTGSVTFLHPANLHRNQRTLRMARLLAKAGTTVRIATGTSDSPPDLGERITVVPIAT